MTAVYEDLAAIYQHRHTDFVSRVGQAQALQAQAQALQAQVEEARKTERAAEMVSALFQSYSEAEHEELRTRIETLVTYGLQTIFGDDLAFRVTQGIERGQATIAFSVVSTVDGESVETEVLEARGGGVAAVIGFVLRVVVLALGPASQRKTIILDETLGMVSADYHEPLSRLLRMLVDQTGLQVVLVTHAPKQALLADKVFRLDHDGSKTICSELSPAEL